MTPEAKVKAKVTQALRGLGVYYFTPVANPVYGKRGVPDIIACIDGRFVAIECKAGKGVLTTLQDRALDHITACGGYALVCSESNIDETIAKLRRIYGR